MSRSVPNCCASGKEPINIGPKAVHVSSFRYIPFFLHISKRANQFNGQHSWQGGGKTSNANRTCKGSWHTVNANDATSTLSTSHQTSALFVFVETYYAVRTGPRDQGTPDVNRNSDALIKIKHLLLQTQECSSGNGLWRRHETGLLMSQATWD